MARLKSGSFKEALSFYKLFHRTIGPQSEAFYCRSQALFESLRKSIEGEKRPTHLSNAKGWGVAIILALVSVFTLLRAKANKLTTVHYLIDIKNSEGVYDRRSEYIFQGLPPAKTINFFHLHHPRNVFFSFGQRANAVYFESLWKVVGGVLSRKKAVQRDAPAGITEAHLHVWKDQCEREAESERQTRFWQWLFRWLCVQRIVCLDDARHTGELRLACQREGIETIAYMHARFNEYHVGLARPRFDRYLIWSEYFRDVLYELNPEYKKSQVAICGYPMVIPSNKIKRNVDLPLRVMLLGESNTDLSELNSYVEALAGMENVTVTYRGKPGYGGGIPYQLPPTALWNVDRIPDFLESLRENGIDVVVGTHSTALMECWLVGVPAIMIRCSYDYAWGLVETGIITGCHDVREFNAQILRLSDMGEQKLNEHRKKLWSDQPEWSPEQLSQWLNPVIQN